MPGSEKRWLELKSAVKGGWIHKKTLVFSMLPSSFWNIAQFVHL